MKTKVSVVFLATFLSTLSAMADCSAQANAVAQGIAEGCSGSSVQSLRRASWLGEEGYYATLDKDCMGGLVGYRIKMAPRSCALLEATADLGE